MELTLAFATVEERTTMLRAFHKLLEIFQKVFRNFSKSCSNVAQKNHQKLLFVTKVDQTLSVKQSLF